MKRVDIVDVKADIRDGELEVVFYEIGSVTEILLRDTKTEESICLTTI